MQDNYIELPQPQDLSDRDKEDAMGAYLMMFGSLAAGLPLPIINLIASVIYFYLNKSKSPFVYFHSYQSLISQIPLTIMNMGCLSWGIFGEGYKTDDWLAFLILMIIANLVYFVFSLIGCMKARKGKMYYFLFFGKLAYIKAFSKRHNPQSVEVNKPPSL
jgi:uncharacterized Tic20 family protein